MTAAFIASPQLQEVFWVFIVNAVFTVAVIFWMRKEHRHTIKILGRVMHELEDRARYDHLTGALRASAFEAEGVIQNARARRYKEGSVLVMDLDHFKDINDTQGHQAGDRALRSVSAAIKARLRDSDIFGRIGGDEFAVIVPHGDMHEALGVANGIRQAIESAPPPTMTASIGMAELGDDDGWAEALHSADVAMYRAKKDGGNRVVQAGARVASTA